MSVCMAACGSKNKNAEALKPESKQSSSLDKDYSWLMDKTVSSADSIIDYHPEVYGLYLFTGQDCNSCVNAGFYVSKKIDSLCGQRTVYAVASAANLSMYQRENEYYEYVYTDDGNKIRKELKYLPTPVLLLMEGNKVKDVFFPRDTNPANYRDFVAKFK